MTKKLSFGFAFLLAALLIVSSVAAAPAPQIDCPICNIDLSGYTGPLSETEVQGLLLALNDEYHAWAVYNQVVIDYGETAPFANIRQSEASHIAALVNLFNIYGVPVPENPWVGNVPSFASLPEACSAGVQAEILNRDLYTHLFETTDNANIEQVYQFLQQASEQKHLPAFENCGSGGQGFGQGNGYGASNGRGANGNGPTAAVAPAIGDVLSTPEPAGQNGQGAQAPDVAPQAETPVPTVEAAVPGMRGPQAGQAQPAQQLSWWQQFWNWISGQ
jgi:hypothetical protein